MKKHLPRLKGGLLTLALATLTWASLATAAHAASEAIAATDAVAATEAFAADTRSPEALCPTEKFDSVTVQGKYLGWQLPRTPHDTITIRLRDSHVPLHIITSATRAQSLFGENYDAAVEVTYDFIQHYSREDKKCLQLYVLKTGKIIEKQKKTQFFH